MLSYMFGCIRKVVIYIPTYIHINGPCICFTTPLQINLNVLQYLKHYETSQQSRWPTLPAQAVGGYAVLYVILYMFCDIQYQTYFQINLGFIFFILTLQIILTVSQYLKHNRVSYTSRWPSLLYQLVGRDAVLYVSLYMFRRNIIPHIFPN